MLGSIDTTAAAYGSYDPATNHVSYFAVLKIETNPSYTDEDQMYAAGYLEGALTTSDTYDLWQNLLSTFGWASNQPPSCIADFFVTQDEYIRSMIATAADNRAFWDALGLVMEQFDGLCAGYNATAQAGQGLPLFAFAAMSAIGDLGDVGSGACPALRPNFDNMTQQEFEQYVNLHGHCSSLVKLTGDFSQLYMAHVTWSSYQTMNRIYKHCTNADYHACASKEEEETSLSSSLHQFIEIPQIISRRRSAWGSRCRSLATRPPWHRSTTSTSWARRLLLCW